MNLRHLITDFAAMAELLQKEPDLMANIEIVEYSTTLLVYRNTAEEEIVLQRRKFAVTKTFHLCFASQVEAHLCQEYEVVKFLKPVKIYASKRL